MISLEQKRWGVHVGNLVRCRGLKDFEILKTMFESVLLEARAAEQLTAQKMLESAGRTLIDGPIQVGNVRRWNAGFMTTRAQTRLPLTMSSLESFHGHGTKLTPRRNEFWSSLHCVMQDDDTENNAFSTLC
jgi:hypothetical protein